MTLALVTGGSGFIGAHVVRALLEEGVEVRALVRPESSARNLGSLAVQRAEGDLRDRVSLDRALEGVEVLFHVAGLYELAARERRELHAINVQGTRELMLAALQAGVQRVVHTSSVAAIGHAGWRGKPADEQQWADSRKLAGPYEESKYLSERLVQELVRREGLPAVVVNPTAPIGPLDVKPTPTGRLIVDAANGSLPGYVRSAGLNIVHVRDVARGHVLAWQRGRVGERYILGQRQGNLTLHEVLQRAAAVVGQEPPRRALPYFVALAYAQVDERVVSRVRGRPPRAPIAGVRLARHKMWFTCDKAVHELGLPQTDVEEAFQDAVDYFMSEGLVRA